MKKTLFYLLLLLSLDLTAQMYVSPSSFVYVNDAYVYVKQDMNLDNNGNFYLRNKSQLLQGNVGSSLNSGLGNLSVFQEGTSNNFGYNYWCSPVGVPAASVGNSTFGITRLFRPTDVVNSSAATILPSSSLNGTSTGSSLSIASRWIYKFVQSNQYSQWAYVGNASTLAAGEGFTMKGVSGSDNVVADANEGVANNPGNNQRYDFRGKPNEGTINIPVGTTPGPDYPNRTLTGNPYPSAINLNLFLLENSGYTVNYTTGSYTLTGAAVINGNAYFWEHEKPATSHYVSQYIGGYGVYVANGATAFSPGTYTSATWNTYNANGTPNSTGSSTASVYKRMFTPIGQGFQVQGAANGNAQMKNAYRTFVKEGVASNSQFDRNANKNSSFSNTNWEEIPNVANVDYTQFSKEQVPQFKIHTIMNDQYTRETVIAFNDNATDGYDLALDAVTPESNLPRDVFFPLENNLQFVISTLPFDIDKKMPLAFKADINTVFKVAVNELINFNMAQDIYLHDKQTDEYFDIKNSFFSITLAPGLYKDRFEITFKNNSSSLGINDEELNSFSVYQNNDAQNLTIFNPLFKDVKDFSMYDVTGKKVISKMNLGNSEQIQVSTSGLSDGVYFVKLVTQDNLQVDKKVSIFRK
ncbi:T9SS type A sorting domain-containing protein [Flavobacterium sp. 9AF]|uniref:T9SS type A sorting domain-containing protein n=1 Tax=Flavobacterium sp. 9AF TaxID=2653142 RepID=UPI00135A801E|nr:T9SS type A sorting domain-containing protein [Flavobacterium sp. 9AF]